jgi:RNA polymerase sigma-70 factor (ECF subfamily)
MADERALVARILKGEDQAFNELYSVLRPRLLKAAAHFLGYGDPAVEDVVQESFAKALPRLSEFRFEASLFTWFNRFVVNLCLQEIDKRKKWVLAETIQLEGWSKPLGPQVPEAMKQAIRTEMAALPPEQAEVLKRRDLEGQAYLDIAKDLGLAPGTVMSRLHRGRQALAVRLKARAGVYKSFFKES